ncbi:unnamed protein product [Pedinophyceae sp. YPF-701]|nr:unnamed protein product [Pedinophyceae sp. YPF-701]
MVRRRKKSDKEENKEIFFCYYCDREFPDEQTVILHQKSKHWKCENCQKKVNSASGLRIHCRNVHKMEIRQIPGAKPGKDDVSLEVYGMAGVPLEAINERREAAGLPPKQPEQAPVVASIQLPPVSGPPGFPPPFGGMPRPPVPGFGAPPVPGFAPPPGGPPRPGYAPPPGSRPQVSRPAFAAGQISAPPTTTGTAVRAPPRPAASVQQPPFAAPGELYVWCDNELSVEEVRAMDPKYNPKAAA